MVIGIVLFVIVGTVMQLITNTVIYLFIIHSSVFLIDEVESSLTFLPNLQLCQILYVVDVVNAVSALYALGCPVDQMFCSV